MDGLELEEVGEEACEGANCCYQMLVLFISLIILLCFAISVKRPTCSLQEFYIPALNKAANANTVTPSNTIFFDIKLNNKNLAKGVKYAPINLTFYYGPNTSFPIGNYVVPGFYQGIKKDTNRRQLVETHGVPWESALGLVSNGSTVIFRVGLATTVRFKFLGVLYKKHNMVVGATVNVDYSGEKVDNDDIKLKSGAPSEIECRRRGWVGLFAVVIGVGFMI